MLFALENTIQTEAKSGRAPTATHTYIRLYRVHKPTTPPEPDAIANRTRPSPHIMERQPRRHTSWRARARGRAQGHHGGGIQSRSVGGDACGGRARAPARGSSSAFATRCSAARGATRARRERAFGAARSGAPERRRPQSCTTRRQAPAVSARRRLTDTAAPTHPCLRALHAYVERHTPCYQSKRAWFELDERAVGIRTAASGVREEVRRHVVLPSSRAVILITAAAPARWSGEYSMAVM